MIFPLLFRVFFPKEKFPVNKNLLSHLASSLTIIKNPKVSLCDDAEHLAQRSAGVGRSIQSYREVSVLDAPPKKSGDEKTWVGEMDEWGPIWMVEQERCSTRLSFPCSTRTIIPTCIFVVFLGTGTWARDFRGLRLRWAFGETLRSFCAISTCQPWRKATCCSLY